MTIYNLTEWGDNYVKTWGRLWQYYRNELVLLLIFLLIITVLSLNLKKKTVKIGDDSINIIDTIVLLKYLSNFWRTIEMPLIDCEVNLSLTWCSSFVFCNAAAQAIAFTKNDTKFYVPVVTLSTQDNVKLLKQLESCFKRTINWNSYESKVSAEILNQYLDDLIDPIFLSAKKLFYHF